MTSQLNLDSSFKDLRKKISELKKKHFERLSDMTKADMLSLIRLLDTEADYRNVKGDKTTSKKEKTKPKKQDSKPKKEDLVIVDDDEKPKKKKPKKPRKLRKLKGTDAMMEVLEEDFAGFIGQIISPFSLIDNGNLKISDSNAFRIFDYLVQEKVLSIDKDDNYTVLKIAFKETELQIIQRKREEKENKEREVTRKKVQKEQKK